MLRGVQQSMNPLGEAMQRRNSALAIAFIVLIFMFSVVRMHPTAASADPEVVAFVGAKIYMSPTDPPLSNGTVVIRGEKIAAVGKTGTLSIPPDAKQNRLQGRSDYRRLSK
jgi:hypothetical protein